jgi:hypothetical protein
MSVQDESRNSRSRFLKLFAFLVFVVQLTACKAPTAQDVAGTWQVDYGNSKLTLTLNKDWTFEQVFQKKGEKNIVRRTGNWELTELEGPAVLLNGALFVQDETGAIDWKLSAGNKGGWVLHINKTFGHLSLTVNEDLGLYFEKTPPR